LRGPFTKTSRKVAPPGDRLPRTRILGNGDRRRARRCERGGGAARLTTTSEGFESATPLPSGLPARTRSLMPVRKLVNGAWTGLDATLKRNPDGSITPTVSTGDLTLSGGGTGPLATMHTADKILSVGMPMTLPTPTLSGKTATYSGVLPGVDLKISADTQGGFSDVLVVRDPTAAANPAWTIVTRSTAPIVWPYEV